jgi:hypothetical protein
MSFLTCFAVGFTVLWTILMLRVHCNGGRWPKRNRKGHRLGKLLGVNQRIK